MRATAFGSCSFVARIGAVFAPVVSINILLKLFYLKKKLLLNFLVSVFKFNLGAERIFDGCYSWNI